MSESKIIRWLTALLIGVLLIAAVIPMPIVVAAESRQSSRTVRIAFPFQAGMSEQNIAGALSGYNYDYIETLSEYTGWKIEYITFEDMSENDAVMKAMEMVQNGEADLIGTTLKNEYTESMFDFPQKSYGVVYTTLFTTENNLISETNYFLKKPLRVAVYKDAVTRNSEVTDFLNSNKIEYEFIPCDTQEQQYQIVRNGDADVLSCVSLNRLPNTRTIASFAQRPYYFVTTKGNTTLLAELDEAIRAIDYSRPYFQSELQYKYFGPSAVSYDISNDDQKMLQEVGSLNVLCIANDAPYVFKEKDGSPTGLLVSILNDFAERTGLKLQYKFCDSFDDVSDILKTGAYDCVIGMPLSSDFCAESGIVRSYPIANIGLVTVKKDTMKKAMEDATIGVSNYLADEAEISGYKEVVPFNSTEECLNAVRKGKVDICCGSRSVVEYYNYESSQSLITTPMVGFSRDVCIGFSKNLGIDFLTCANNYLRSLDDITKNAYISEANYHLAHSPIAHFIHTQPLQASIVIILVVSLVFGSIVLTITAVRRKKRNEELAQANSAKTDFLSRISHDMRTPMNGILGLTTLMKDKTDLSEIRSDLDQLQLSGKYLLNLINDTLDMNRIESGKLELHRLPIESKRIVMNVVQNAKMMAAEKGIELVVNVPSGIKSCFPIVADSSRLEQVMIKLVSNAIKYTQAKGKVELTMERVSVSPEKVVERFIVKDNGIGMSKEFLPHLFETFSQEGRARNDRESGSGLGMAIVKQLITIMDGSIEVESELNKGTTITVILPFERYNGTIQELTENNMEADLHGKKLLLCEDHPLNAKIAIKLLEKVGTQITLAENGQIGMEIFDASESNEYDAILMDLRMPVMDGLEATKAIRQLERSDAKTIPIIAMTANAFDDDVKACLDAGMNDHLAKPVNPKLLYSTLQKYLNQQV